MSASPSPSPPATSDASLPAREVTLRELFVGFFKVGISGFGGVLPWARRMLVQERRWLTEREFVDTLSLCQALPGPNIVNVSLCVGLRFQGVAGALVAFVALMAAPFAIALVLASFYARYLEVPAVHGAIRGVACSAAGLVVAMGIKMLGPYGRSVRAVAFIVATFLAVAVMRYPLIAVLLALGPPGVLAAWRTDR